MSRGAAEALGLFSQLAAFFFGNTSYCQIMGPLLEIDSMTAPNI